MLALPFEKPVRVWVGLGFPRQINSVADALQFVLDCYGYCPDGKTVTRVCKAAMSGEVEADTARGFFVTFARKKEILVEDGSLPPFRSEDRQAHA